MNGARLMRAQARNNAWANHRLLSACAALGEEEFGAQCQGFFPSLRATLNHILIIDHFHVDALERGSLGPAAWADREPCRNMSTLQGAQGAMDRRLIALGDALDESGLSRIIAVNHMVRIQRERCDRLLLHLFQHQIHHRGQAHGMLGRDAPQLDEFYCLGEAPQRANEFTAPGFSEQDIWQEAR